MEETAELLRSVGFRDTAYIEANGVTGDDLLELTEQELRQELGLTHLQVLLTLRLCRELGTATGQAYYRLHSINVKVCCALHQAKKIRGLQAAFKTFNSIMRRPGSGDITFLELQVCSSTLLTRLS